MQNRRNRCHCQLLFCIYLKNLYFETMINTTDSSHRTTLQDIADHCELSRSTVARVLNGNAGNFRIASATIERVQLAAKQVQVERGAGLDGQGTVAGGADR